jgi:hypothetical protein
MKRSATIVLLLLTGAGFLISGAVPAMAATLQDSSTPPLPDLTGVLPIVHDGDTNGATKEFDEMDHGFHAGGASIWGSFSTAEAGVYIFDTTGSGFDTCLGVYVPGGTLPEYERIGANNNIDGANPINDASQSRVFLPAGELVHVAVDGVAGAVGTVVLTISKATATDTNDNLANARNLGNTSPVNLNDTNLNASREIGEPIHGVDDASSGTTWGGASLWYKWTAPTTADYIFSTAGSTQDQTATPDAVMDTLLSVYSGPASNPTFDQLVPIAEANDSGGLLTSRVAFNVTAGTTYYIAVDGRNSVSTFQHRGSIQLSITPSPEQTIAPFNQDWEYLSPASDPVNPGIDPAILDADFVTTWPATAEGFTVSGATVYDGPAFVGPSPALIGFDVIDFASTVTPLPLNEIVLYVRRKFTLAAPVTVLNAEVIADDGAITYLDGVEVSRINMGAPGNPPDIYDYTPSASVGVENASSRVNVAINIPAGDHILAASVHNASATSSDIGFDLRLYSDSRAPIITSGLGVTGSEGTPFSYQIGIDPTIPATSYGATNLPAGLSIDTVTGLISGTPAAQGTTQAQITATNPGGSDTETLTISITGPFGDVVLAPGQTVGTGFEEPARLSTSYVRGTNGSVEIGFSYAENDTAATAIIDVRDPQVAGDHAAAGTSGVGSDAPHTAPPNKFLRIRDADFDTPFRTDKINISGLTPEQKSAIEVRIDIRSFTTSSTTFEVEDVFHIFLEGSQDGVNYFPLGDLLNVTGGDPDDIIAFRSDDGLYTTLSLPGAGLITADINSLQLVIEEGPDSESEYVYLDNIEFEAMTSTPTSNFRITSVTKVGTAGSVTFNAEIGQSYILEGSATMQTGAWTLVLGTGPIVADQAAETFNFTWPGTARYHVRVRRQ